MPFPAAPGSQLYFYPVAAQNASYDAFVEHPYAIHSPITDSNTLYQERVASNTALRGPLLSVQTALLAQGKSPEAMWLTEWDD